MKRKWYCTNIAKGVIILAEHIFLLIMVLSFLWMMSYPVLRTEIFSGSHSGKYEDTTAFADQVLHTGQGISNGISLKEKFETDGVYDPEKLIDVAKYIHGGEYSQENEGTLSYKLGDLVSWGKDLSNSTEEASYYDGNIIVCQRSDGTYHYYYYEDFQHQIESGELSFVMAAGEDGMTEDEILGELRDRTYYGEETFKGVQDAEGKILYVNCWNYDGYWCQEEYKTADGRSILEVANEDEAWNGRLNDAFNAVETAASQIYWEEDQYQNVFDAYQEGDTNFTYLYVDGDSGQVVTNRKAFEDVGKIDESLEALRESGKYAIVRPKLKDFDTNMKNVDAALWKDSLIPDEENEDTIFAVGVDTSYPVQDSFYTESQLYEEYGGMAVWVFAAGAVSAILFVAGLILLTMASGRRTEDDETHLIAFDRWKTEISAVLVFLVWLIPAMLLWNFAANMSVVSYDEYGNVIATETASVIPYFSAEGLLSMVMLVVYTCAVFLAGYLSLVRRIKAKILWENSLLKSLGHFLKILFRNMNIVWKRILVFAVFVLIHWFAVFSYGSFFFFGLMVLADFLAFIYLVKDAIGKQRIKRGIEQIAGGQVEYKIDVNALPGEQRDIAEKINTIGEGLDRAVEESIKSERLKTDLITNVSHDIKTPLTSIINYVELLKQENFQDPKIQRYIEVLEEKSQRLKTLTEDVVEASKVSSGNITLEYMDINFVEMVQQTSGEFEEKFKARNLTEVLTLPEDEVIIRVDGRRMWRVLENIYNNAAKYAMEGTRVYADLKVIDGKAVFSLKNISQQQLNISADELTERFIRGDISRSTEGSGLGLSIAKTLTEMQGGKFELYLDGDLFRVTIIF